MLSRRKFVASVVALLAVGPAASSAYPGDPPGATCYWANEYVEVEVCRHGRCRTSLRRFRVRYCLVPPACEGECS